MEEKIAVNLSGGEKLAAFRFWPEGRCNYVLITCHGFRGAKENGGRIFTFARRVNELGMGVVAFDFRGSGESDGEFFHLTLSRQADDLKGVINHVSREFDLPVICLGRSLGGATVLAGAAGDGRVRGYVFWSTPLDLPGTIKPILGPAYNELAAGREVELEDQGGRFKLGPGLVDDFKRHKMAYYVKQLAARPVLLVHGTNDEVVPSANAAALFAQAANAELYMVPGADHRFIELSRLREDITIRWLKKRFGGH